MNIRGPLFFGAVHHIEEELRHNLEDNPGQHLLVLRMHGVDICDLSGIEMLESTVNTYRSIGGDVFLVRLREPVEQVMRDSGFLDFIGRDHILPQEGAIEYLFEDVLDPAVCIYECEHRVFAECQALEKHPYRAQVPSITRVSLDPAHHCRRRGVQRSWRATRTPSSSTSASPTSSHADTSPAPCSCRCARSSTTALTWPGIAACCSRAAPAAAPNARCTCSTRWVSTTSTACAAGSWRGGPRDCRWQ